MKKSTTKKMLNAPKTRNVKVSVNRFGGRATAGGVNYEVRIAALIATKMLTGDRCSIWDGISGADVVSITMQASEPVDDVVVSLAGDADASVFLSAKERAGTVPLTAKSPAFSDTINAFVRQFIKLPLTTRAKSRLIWAVSSSAGRATTQDLASVLNDHREDAGDVALSRFLSTRQVKQRHVLNALLNETRKHWEDETGKAAEEDELRDFFRHMYVVVYDFECGQRNEREAEDTIRTHIVADPKHAKHVWGKMEHLFARVDQRGIRVTASSLRRYLTAEGLTLKSVPDYTDDIVLLNETTKRNLTRLKEHTSLRFGARTTDAVHIHRNDELTALIKAAKAGHHLITGEPGCGKSGLIHPLAETLQKDGTPVVLLLAEEVFRQDRNGFDNLLGLKHALDNVLANWSNGHRGFLITDALDALRDVEMQKQFRRLLHDVKEGQSGWTVIASVREFDLKHSQELRDEFPGTGVSEHCSGEFSSVAHFHLTGLSDANLDELVAVRADIRPFIESARLNPKSGGIHRSPFFLRLASELLRDGITPVRLADWNSPAVLLRKYWEARIEDGEGDSEREVVIRIICRRMLDAHSMALSNKELALGSLERKAINELRSRGVLQAPLLKFGTRVGQEDIRFNHHLLFDYAIARCVIPSIPERFVDFTISQPLLPVFYRQSFMFALEELWDAPAGSDGFWLCALKLEEVPQLHSVARILAPILASRRVETSSDLQPLLKAIECATGKDAPAVKALCHLASGLQDAVPDAIRVGATAWCKFAECLATLLLSRSYVESPLVQILARLNDVSAARTRDGQTAVNIAGRSLLAHHISKEVAKGWRYAADTAIHTICRTFRIAPAESEQSLLSLLTPQRLASFPQNDLFDFAHRIACLKSHGDVVVLKLFEVAFSVAPKPGEWENFGGAILPLRMQTSDNWSVIRYSLADYYETRDGQNAALMTEIACIAWNAVVMRKSTRYESDERVVATIQFRGVSCDLIEDYGHIGGRDFEHEENRIITHFEKLLRGWATANDTQRLTEALDQFARRNRTSLMWTVIMAAGAEQPTTLGVLLEGVLSESLFLTHPDYSYGGTALLGALHKLGDVEGRGRLERLILDLPQTARFFREEPRDPLPSWLERAQDRLLGVLENPNVVLPATRALLDRRSKLVELAANQKPESVRVRSRKVSDEKLLEMRGIDLKESVSLELFKLLEALKQFTKGDDDKIDIAKLEQHHWRLIGQSERAVQRHHRQHQKLTEELWGQLTRTCEKFVRQVNWPATSQRWKTIRRILLKAANDPIPKVSSDEVATKDCWPHWSLPAPRIDAAMGLPFLVLRLGRSDKTISAALRKLCHDKSHALRFNLADRLSVLEKQAPDLMWKLIDDIIANERMFSVLEMVVNSLDRVWEHSPDDAKKRIQIIFERAIQYASADNGIHETLARVYLFRYLRTGNVEYEKHIAILIDDCDKEYASHALERQLHDCRCGGWLTAENNGSEDIPEDAVSGRTLAFFLKMVSTALEKLRRHREQWQRIHQNKHPDAEAVKAIQESINQATRLIDRISMQLYFASGTFDEKENKNVKRMSISQRQRFWERTAPLFEMLATEIHTHIVHQTVQTLQYLLPCAPHDIFLLAAKSICSSATVGFQHESMAVSEVVKLIQRALADHRDIFQSAGGKDSECLESLLRVLDLFVDAGWSEARALTHRLEDIYR